MTTPHAADRDGPTVWPGAADDDTQQLGPPPPGGPPGQGDEGPGHRRSRWIWLLVAGVGALVLLVPLVTYALLGTGSDGEASAGSSPPTQPVPTQPASTVPAPTESGATPSAKPKVPDGRIPMVVLRNATLDIPAWPPDALNGPSGRVKFADGQSEEQASTGYRMYLADRLAYGDVDRDGAQETVIRVGFGGEGQSLQVLALDRDINRTIVTIGRVLATTGPIKVIDEDVAVTAGGQVRIRVGDFQACCGQDPIAQWQTRVYARRSGRFVQVGGPTAFPQNPRMTELSVAANDVVLGVPVKGVRHGALAVTVHAVKPVRPDHLRFVIALPDDVIREGVAWAGARVEAPGNGYVQVVLDLPAPATGQSRTYTFGVGRAADASGGNTISVFVSGRTALDQDLVEGDSDNNLRLLRISAVS
jgi:hypothetical protein